MFPMILSLGLKKVPPTCSAEDSLWGSLIYFPFRYDAQEKHQSCFLCLQNNSRMWLLLITSLLLNDHGLLKPSLKEKKKLLLAQINFTRGSLLSFSLFRQLLVSQSLFLLISLILSLLQHHRLPDHSNMQSDLITSLLMTSQEPQIQRP
jgi:hypothetical protein